MKKLLIVLAFAGFTMSSMAQDEVPELKHSVATNSFWNNWFIQAGVQWGVFYTGEEHGDNLTQNPFKGFRSSPELAIGIGKWFVPELGARLKFNGIWGRTVNENEVKKSNKFWNIHLQPLFNLSNIMYGYNPDRTWNVIPFAGLGVSRTCSVNLYTIGFSVGVLNTFKISDRTQLHLELGWDRHEPDFSGDHKFYSVNDGPRGWDSHDNMLYAELGLTFNVGKTGWDKVPDVNALKQLSQSQLDALNAQLADANNTINNLRDELAKKPTVIEKPAEVITKSVKDFITTPISVFFNLNKTEIAVLKDLVNVKALAKFAIENDRNILVTGYADSATGTPERNQWLSEKRAERVKNELIEMGVKPEKITTTHYGGVEILTPVDFNRRATVQITEEE